MPNVKKGRFRLDLCSASAQVSVSDEEEKLGLPALIQRTHGVVTRGFFS